MMFKGCYSLRFLHASGNMIWPFKLISIGNERELSDRLKLLFGKRRGEFCDGPKKRRDPA
jgi:hypothetical protein